MRARAEAVAELSPTSDELALVYSALDPVAMICLKVATSCGKRSLD